MQALARPGLLAAFLLLSRVPRMGELVRSGEEASDVVRFRQSQVPAEGTGRDCFSLAQPNILLMGGAVSVTGPYLQLTCD